MLHSSTRFVGLYASSVETTYIYRRAFRSTILLAAACSYVPSASATRASSSHRTVASYGMRVLHRGSYALAGGLGHTCKGLVPC
ncbi:hypothetical protein OH77DRAFT_866326 [Trametes cingulata]|nr:hypothetical protein OH77DRAFT_866326 [Trametes cingulata]